MGPVGLVRKLHKDIVGRSKFLFLGLKMPLGFLKTLIPIVRRVLPNVIAADILGVQPMAGPTAHIFTLKHRYGLYGIEDGTENIHYHWGRELQNQWSIMKKVLLS